MDNLINFMSPDEFNKLSDDEKRENVRDLIHGILKDSKSKAVLFNPIDNQSASLENVIEAIGEEKLIDLLVQTLERGEMQPQKFSKEEVEAAIERKENGTATKEDEQMLAIISNISNQNDAFNFNQTLITILVDLIEFTQTDRGYKLSIGDLLATINLISTITCAFTEGSSLEKYQQLGPTAIHNMAKEMGQDIVDTWKNTCTEIPDDYMMLCALLEITQVYANKIHVCDADVYKNILSDVLCDFNVDECDENCHCESENGSNEESKQPNITKPNTHTPTDQNMRDMLKD